MLRVSAPLDVERIRADFPILRRQVNGRRLIYLDNAATTQKPRQVIDALVDFYTNTNANVHRGVHTLSVEATDAYESARREDAEMLAPPPAPPASPASASPASPSPGKGGLPT